MRNQISGKYSRLRLVERVNTEKLALDRLKEYGLKAAPQGPIKVKRRIRKLFGEKY